MTLEQFRTFARDHDLVPVSREVLFDTNTAVTAYAKLKDGPFGFLLESVVGGEKWARYTFLGSAPREAIRVKHGVIAEWHAETGWQDVSARPDPLDYIADRLSKVRVPQVPGLPRFFGGAVGYLGYDVVRYIEQLGDGPPDDLQLPEALLIFTDTIVAIDNLFGKARIICMTATSGDLDSAYAAALTKIDAIIEKLARPMELSALSHGRQASPAHARQIRSSYEQADFERAVDRIRDYIKAGDAFQVVLSQRLSLPFNASPLTAYRSLRSLNPSPYMYLLELDDVALVGSSPEVFVRVEDRRVVVRPIAGTRRRGMTDEEDAALIADLLADEKERAEHLMLVDLGRNDIGRVAEYDSVAVTGLMQVEKYSHVLHLVTQVEGRLLDGRSAVDVFRACFPAGTVSGAPKVRALEIIDELEPVRRGPYAGAVGYFAFGGQNMDTAIAIRTIVIAADMAYVQAGAGVVIDSVPRREWEETLSKAAVLLQAMEAM